MRRAEELLYDSEASLRLVDNAIEELHQPGIQPADDTAEAVPLPSAPSVPAVLPAPGPVAPASATFAELSRTLLRAYSETASIFGRLRETAGVIDGAGIERLRQMHGRLRAVSSATEAATTDILDGLARAATLVERLDSASTLSDEERHRMSASLREELDDLVNHLQFQDITGQQLHHVGNLLSDVNRRLTQVVQIFSSPAPEGRNAGAGAEADPSDDDGTWPRDQRTNQALADEICNG